MTAIPNQLPDLALERELFSLVSRERLARDTADWDKLSSLYWPDSYVRVTWFEGTAAEFIEVSRDQAQRGRGRGIHVITPIWSEAVGDRALVESRGQILIRPRLAGVECDVTSWCRFFSKAERRNGTWRLVSFDSIYGKDRIDTVDPGAPLQLDSEILGAARPSYKHLTYLNLSAGYTVSSELPGDDRADLVADLYAKARAWLHG